jgi:chitodextrinase
MKFSGIRMNYVLQRLFMSFLFTMLILSTFTFIPNKTMASSTTCSTASCLTTALANAQAGDVITLADGVTLSGNFTASANGTSSAKITIQSSSSNKAILNGGGTGSGYTLHITGDYWVIKNVKVTNASKGIMLDNSNNTLIDGVEVYNIGEEGVHFRDGSSNNTIQNSYIHDTGVVTADYGEGVYVGSDYLKWTDNGGAYIKECDNNKIVNNTIGSGVAAESVDIKEGTTGTIISGNTFNGTGISGANAADSFIDAKGNDAVIHDNIGYRNNNSNINDAFQTNEKSTGWGFNNDFYNNTVYMDNTTGYVVNVKAGSAKACNNTRSPSGNMYTGAVTTYTSCSSDTQAPTAPTNLAATAATSSQINLSWTASTDNVGVASYDVYRGGSFLKNVAGTSTSDTGLAAGTTYSYDVKAKDAAGNVSAASNTASATTSSGGTTDAKFSIPGSSVTASTSDTNVPANAVDGSLSTRWSGEGDGAWIQFDLGSNKKVAYVNVAFYSGSTRTSTFDIQTSTDGTSFTTVQSGLTSALNDNLQTFDFADVDPARYVRLVGHGNTSNDWNSYTEVEVWGTDSSGGGSDAKITVPGSSVTASTSDTNVPANAVDGSLSTRWSGEGDGAWIQLDLGSNKTVAYVKVAFYNGSSRTSTFDIQTSTDGTNFTTVQSGLTSALNDNLQTFDFTDVSSARYVRLVGHGNSSNDWNSYTEVEVWGR